MEAIPFELLPETCVLKSNCQSDGKYIHIVKNSRLENIQNLKREMTEWLRPQNTLLNSFCRAYYDVTPLIIAEEYLENIFGQLYDYKIFCFAGEPLCIYAASDHFTVHGKQNLSHITFYDFDWNPLDIKYGSHPVGDIPKPPHLSEMIDVAKVLSKDFPFVRVDYFDTVEKLYLAEMTFYPGGGFTSYSEKVDFIWGKQFVLPEKNNLGRKFRTDLNYIG